MPDQTVDGEPVLGRQARGAGDVAQELGTLLGIRHFCKKKQKTEDRSKDGTFKLS